VNVCSDLLISDPVDWSHHCAFFLRGCLHDGDFDFEKAEIADIELCQTLNFSSRYNFSALIVVYFITYIFLPSDHRLEQILMKPKPTTLYDIIRLHNIFVRVFH
jgi:hypothetical protein